MKLYTEEQVKVLINALDDIRDWDDDLEVDYDDAGSRAVFALNNFSQVTPIELPSDEDIDKYIEKTFYGVKKHYFKAGVEFMKELIVKQNK